MKKQNQSAVFKHWLSHVKATPSGMIPVLLNGTVPAWNVATGPMKKIHAYLSSVAPRNAWPDWALTGGHEGEISDKVAASAMDELV